jgi:hypothetical protein
MLGPVVEIALNPSPLGVARLDQPRAGFAKIQYARAPFHLESLALEPERRGSAGGAHQARFLAQTGVVDERRDGLPRHVDQRHGSVRIGPRQDDRFSLVVDVAAGCRQPVHDRQGAIAQ